MQAGGDITGKTSPSALLGDGRIITMIAKGELKKVESVKHESLDIGLKLIIELPFDYNKNIDLKELFMLLKKPIKLNIEKD